jgi:hypothetical protein
MSNKRPRLETEEIDTDDIGSINNNIRAEENVTVDNPSPIEKEAEQNTEKLRLGLKRLFLTHPSLSVLNANEEVKIIDTLSFDELKNLEIHVKNQIGGLFNQKLSKGIIDSVSYILPFIDNEGLIQDLEHDSSFQEAWNTFINLNLLHLPEEIKLALVYGTHVIKNLTFNPFVKKQKKNETTEPPISDVNMRSLELGENHPSVEPSSEG